MDDNSADYLRIMDAAGVDKSCVNCINFGEARRGNDLVARIVAEHPTTPTTLRYSSGRTSMIS